VVRRDGVELADLWEVLRRQVDERPTPVRVEALVRRSRLDMFARMFAPHLAGTPASPTPGDGVGADEAAADGRVRAGGGLLRDSGEWAEVSLRFAAVPAARPLLSFGDDVVVLSPPEVRDDLLAVASAVTACYSAAPATRFAISTSILVLRGRSAHECAVGPLLGLRWAGPTVHSGP
jgi:hypothetical protein